MTTLPDALARPRPPWRARARSVGLLCASLVCVPTLRAQVPTPAPTPAVAPADEAQQRDLAAAQELLTRAVAEFEGTQQGRAISVLDELATRLEGQRRQGGGLPARGREMLAQAYELRGRAYYNIGLQEKAADSFRQLVQLQPQYALTKERVSPKVVDFYNSVKRALVGFVAVVTRPAGARVTLNGEYLGLSDFFPLDVLAGEYTLEITKEGYQTVTKPLGIAAQATATVQEDLVRVSATGIFVTEPAGVEIWIDGALRVTTAGSLDLQYHEAARAKGVDPARASARSEVAGLSVGEHHIEYRRKCYESVRTTLVFGEARDYEIEPARLTESLAVLQLRSDPPGAQIFIDGEKKGLTPLEIEGVCSGAHRIEVRHAAGRFVQDLRLQKDEVLTLNCPIRPSLAFLGVVAESAAGERVTAEVEERVLAELRRIESLNFFPAPRETVDRALESEHITRRALLSGAGTEGDLIRKVTEKLARTLDVQGFLIALLPEERLQRTVRLHLLAAGNTTSESRDVTYAEKASYQRVLAAIDRKATVYRTWSGLVTVDTRLHEGVPILRVVPGGPAAGAGLGPGEVVRAADGAPVKGSSELLALVESKRPGDALVLQVQGASGAARNVTLTLGETPQEIPLNDPELLYNKVMMDLRQQVDGYPGTEGAAFARLNLGLAALHFGDHAAAHDHFVEAAKVLPQRPGLARGTALYYTGLALEKLGYAQEALEAYRGAASERDATLGNNDGPALGALAQRRAAVR